MNPLIRPARPASRRPIAGALAALAVAGAVAGCSGGPRAAPVAPDRAREALRTALDRWKQGDPPEALKGADPPIVVQDFDWMAGRRLVAYRVLGDGEDDDANLRIPVALTIAKADGGEARSDVTYVVGTDPVLTVFRDFQ